MTNYKTTVNRIRPKNIQEYHLLQDITRASKDLYNTTLYETRQHFFNTRKFLEYKDAYHIIKNKSEYKELPSQAAQQTMKIIEREFKSFFRVLEEKKKGNYNRKNNIPKYLDKDGYFTTIFPKAHIRFNKKDNTKVYLTLSKSMKDKYGIKGYEISIPEHINNDSIKELRITPRHNHFQLEIVYQVSDYVDPVNNNNYLSIDLGVDNLVTMIDNVNDQPIIINGGDIKSMNRYYNKKISHYKSILKKNNNTTTSKRVNNLWLQRTNKFKDYFHKLSTNIIKYCVLNDIREIIVGYNKEWKQNINIGHKNNQNFVQIPYGLLIEYLDYKCKENGIIFTLQEESYTSKCDALSLESIKKHDNYSGCRVKRGLFKSNTGVLVNSDVNGSINIMRKCKHEEVEPWVQSLVSSGCVFQPVKLSLDKFTNLTLQDLLV